jgi:polyisoprenoid-binding protein YceI
MRMLAALSAGPLRRSLLAGLGAGALAALAASLVSLPLYSPDDAFFNTASVTVGALPAGIAAGALWWALRDRPRAPLLFAAVMLAAFVLVAAGALAYETAPSALDRVASFSIPLAAIVFATLALLVPVLSRPQLRPMWTAPAATVAALVLGIALAGRGDAESGRLTLPVLPAPSSSTTVPVAAGAAPSSDGLIRPKDVAGVTFKVASGESAATYTVHEKLVRAPLPGDAVGRTTDLSGTIRLDGQPSKIIADLRTLKSDQGQRDRYIRDMGGLPSSRYPYAEFTVTDLVDLPQEYHPGDTVTGSVTGMMKIREVERPLTFAVEARLQDNVLYIVGRTDFTWADFNIPPPNVRGIVQVENDVHLEILIIAKREGQG